MTAKTYDRQTGKFLARVAENMPEMSGEVMQNWIDDPKGLQNFLKGLLPPINGTAPDLVLPIDRTNPFNPAEFIGKGWSIWRGPANGNGLEGEEEQDARSLALAELDLSKVLLEAHLKEGEAVTTGEERIKRLNAINRIKLDAIAFKTLWENRGKLPERFKQKTNGKTTFIFCDGTTLRGPGGSRYTLYFYWRADNLEWGWRYSWLGRDRSVINPSACLAS